MADDVNVVTASGAVSVPATLERGDRHDEK